MGSLYTFSQDQKRLRLQAEKSIKRDQSLIEDILQQCPKRPLRILDVGCADGFLTNAHFGSLQQDVIMGIDKDKECIALASAKYPRISFKVMDIEAEMFQETFDIIFCSYLLPHVSDAERVIQKLWNTLSPGGIFMVRSGDDGWKTTFPDEDGSMAFLLTIPGNRPFHSDRQQGRKIYTYLSSLFPAPLSVDLQFFPESTVGMSSEERASFFDIYYGFRMRYVENDLELYQHVKQVTERQRARFISDSSLFSFNLNTMCLAYKGHSA